MCFCQEAGVTVLLAANICFLSTGYPAEGLEQQREIYFLLAEATPVYLRLINCGDGLKDYQGMKVFEHSL